MVAQSIYADDEGIFVDDDGVIFCDDSTDPSCCGTPEPCCTGSPPDTLSLYFAGVAARSPFAPGTPCADWNDYNTSLFELTKIDVCRWECDAPCGATIRVDIAYDSGGDFTTVNLTIYRPDIGSGIVSFIPNYPAATPANTIAGNWTCGTAIDLISTGFGNDDADFEFATASITP